MIKVFIFALLFVFFCCGSVYANDSVEYVYRVDARPPEAIFSSGFQARGEERSVENHIRGISCRAGTSAYIATTMSEESALTIAQTLYSQHPTAQYYIYRIRADQNFYSAQTSARRYHIDEPILHGMLTIQREYMALRNIPTNHIEHARNLRWNLGDSRPTISDHIILNQYYNATLHSVANTGAAPFENTRPFLREIWALTSSMTSTCFSSCSKRQQRDTSHSVCENESTNIQFSDLSVFF